VSDVINRTTHEHLFSVNTPDYPVADWIINPDATAIETARVAREAAKPPPLKSEERTLTDIETRLTALERV